MGSRLNRNGHLSRNRARLAQLFRRNEIEQSVTGELPRNDSWSLFAMGAMFAMLVYLMWRA